MGNLKKCFFIAKLVIIIMMMSEALAVKEWWEGAKVKIVF